MRSLDFATGILTILLFGVFLTFVFSIPVYFFWNNCLIGAIDGVNEITFPQAWGINLLAGFMFRSGANIGKGDKP